MNTLDITVVVALAVSFFLGLLISWAFSNARHRKDEQDEAQRSSEKEQQISELRRAVEVERELAQTLRRETAHKLDELQTSATNAIEARARMEGQLEALEDLRGEVADKEDELRDMSEELADLSAEVSKYKEAAEAAGRAKAEALAAKDAEVQRLLAEKDRHIEEQKELLANAETKMVATFDSLSVKALTAVSDEFMKAAKATLETTQAKVSGELKLKQQAIEEMLAPIKESLTKVQLQHEELEKKRTSAFDAIEKGLLTISQEADQLANALRKPVTRGAWGEMNLQTILTNAGLVEGVHFDLQDTTESDEGARLRPDVIVHLPNGRDFIIDSKAVIDNFWDGMSAQDEATKAEKFAAHAKLVRSHVKQLSSKGYWSRYKAAPDCVIMFIPTEGAYQAALEADPSLLTDAHASRIYIANPMTLVNMIHVTAYVLKEESLKQNAHEVQMAASELYDRLAKFAASFDDLGRNLRITVDKYNKAAGSFERRVLPQGRRVSALGAGDNSPLSEPRLLDVIPNALACQEASLELDDETAAEADRSPLTLA